MTALRTLLEETTFELPIALWGKASLLVKKGQLISEGEVLAKISIRTEKEINLPAALGVKGKKVLKFLVKKLGEEVEKGEPVAQKASLFAAKKVLSPISGKLDSLSEEGILKVSAFSEREIKSNFTGKVISISKEKIVIQFSALKLTGKWGKGSQASGVLKMISQDSEKEDVFQLETDILGKILVIPGRISEAFWFKALSLGAAGIVCGFLSKEEFEKVLALQRDNFSPLLVVGDEVIDKETWQELEKFQGKRALIEGEKAQLVISKI